MLFLCFFCGFLLPLTLGQDCACATADVHVRNGAGVSHGSLGILTPGQCVPYKGDQVHNGGLLWAHVEYNGHVRILYFYFKQMISRDCAIGAFPPKSF